MRKDELYFPQYTLQLKLGAEFRLRLKWPQYNSPHFERLLFAARSPNHVSQFPSI